MTGSNHEPVVPGSYTGLQSLAWSENHHFRFMVSKPGCTFVESLARQQFDAPGNQLTPPLG